MDQRMALRASHGRWRERLSALFARTDQRRFGYGQATLRLGGWSVLKWTCDLRTLGPRKLPRDPDSYK